MIIWLDAHLSPSLAKWLNKEFEVNATPLREINLLKAKDIEVYEKARRSNAVLMTKDSDFRFLVKQKGTPPKIIWLRTGNTSNKHLKDTLMKTLPKAIELLNAGEEIVEIID